MTAVLTKSGKVRDRSIDMSVAQREIAPAESSDEIRTFQASSFITCFSGEGKYKRYLKRETLKELLGQIQDGIPFNFKTGFKTTPNLGENEYRLAMSWMRARSLCVKNGHSFTIPSVERVRRAYNEQLQEEAVI